jgi:hypothetical protein
MLDFLSPPPPKKEDLNHFPHSFTSACIGAVQAKIETKTTRFFAAFRRSDFVDETKIDFGKEPGANLIHITGLQ